MDVNELVRTITREVLKQLQDREHTKCCMVLAERDQQVVEKLQEGLEGETDIFFWGEDTNGQTVCRYILPLLSCSDMADLATGKAHGKYTAEVLSLLLHGTEVEVLEFEYRAYSETAPGPLFRLYESHEESLCSFGLKPFQPKRPDTIRLHTNLVTEKVVNEAKEQEASVLMVPVTAQITPLAAETARSLTVNIQKCL